MAPRVPVASPTLGPVRGRTLAYGVLLAAIAAVLVPPLWPPPADSYPLSTYPMFSIDRGAVSAVATVVGVDGAGEEQRLSPGLIGGTDEPMLAVATAGRAARGTPVEQRRLCEQVAGRVARSGRDELVAVRLQVEEHDSVAHVTGDEVAPRSVRVLATCEVER